MRLFAKLLISGVLLAQACAPAVAGTTGILSGVATDSVTRAPLANVRVSAVAPTGRYNATTDNHGFFTLAGVAPDTYAISFRLNGYEPVSIPGQNVFADLVTTISTPLVKSLRTIAHTISRSAGGAFQPHQTTDTYSVTQHQIETIQGNALNLSLANLITSLPGGSYDKSGVPVIRGGRENEANYEFEGIAYTDAFTTQFSSAFYAPGLGLESAQLTPGLGDASQDNYGIGTFNLIAKRGAYPGFATLQGSVGGPAFWHGLNAEWGFAAPNGRFSSYLTIANADRAHAYNSISYNCLLIESCFSTYYQTDRELLGNFVYKFGRDNNMQLQAFVNVSQHISDSGAVGAPGFNLCLKTCDPFFLRATLNVAGLRAPPLDATSGCASALNCNGYTVNPTSNVLLMQSLLGFQKGQTFVNETLAQNGNRPPRTDTNPNNAMKLGYSWNIDSSTFLQAMAFHTDSVSYQNYGEAGGYGAFAFNAFDIWAGGKRSGGRIDLTKQLSEKNLLKTGVMYQYLTPVYDQVDLSFGVFNLELSPNFELPDFIPSASCPVEYGGPGSPVCGYIYNFPGVASPQKVTGSYESSLSHRNDWAYYLDDTWSPNDRLKVEGGLRIDRVNYQIPTPSIDPATCTSLYLPTYQTDANGILLTTPSTNPNMSTTYQNPVTGAIITTPTGVCPVATFPQFDDRSHRPVVAEPVFSATYQIGANDSVRASWGRSVEFGSLEFVDFTADPGYFGGPNGAFFKIPGYGTNCGSLGDQLCANYAEQLYWDNAQLVAGAVPLMPLRPTVFTNADFSWEHQFTRGLMKGVQFKMTPWYRRAHDQIAFVATVKIVGGIPLTNPIDGSFIYNTPTATNQGISFADGVELQFTKEQTYGLSGHVSFTYQNEFMNSIPGTPFEAQFASVPTPSVLLGNIYRVGYISPFVASFDFSYQTHSGWRINPQVQWNVGYPISPGLIAGGFINGKAYNFPYTNATGAVQSLGPFGTDQYVDPMNPGSFFSPNIAATRGIAAASAAGGKLSHPSSITNLVIEYNAPKTWSAGLDVYNLFAALYGGPSINTRWQPVATGISGPLTGLNSTGFSFPQYGTSPDYGTLRSGRNAYIDTPNGIRTYYFYATVKI